MAFPSPSGKHGRIGRLAPIVAIALLGGCATGPSPSTPVWLGQIAPDGQTHEVRVSSWKDLKFVNIVRQRTDFSCGAAALATIFNYAYDKQTSEQQILANMFKVADPDVVREKGFSLLDMKRYVEAVGMRAEGYKVGFDALRGLKVPGIVLLSTKGYKHFVVLRRVSGDKVSVGDPALGNRVIPRKDFEREWNGIVFVVTGEGFDPATVLLNPPEPLSARRLFDQRSPVQDATQYDFGLLPAYSYVF
ncbi:C39 family peptidase [Novosphingobium sp. TH158]|uniref:C39 family peptidase n=1 Tax=Novosphingobium sp. TH158 TaxID=2067455 RepID=UPI000C7B542C|nr:C39 family peptidase [Novosphingobium sp. TH158]PLK26993.1 peptidase C39 [Novosphingobium sp. TH158]